MRLFSLSASMISSLVRVAMVVLLRCQLSDDASATPSVVASVCLGGRLGSGSSAVALGRVPRSAARRVCSGCLGGRLGLGRLGGPPPPQRQVPRLGCGSAAAAARGRSSGLRVGCAGPVATGPARVGRGLGRERAEHLGELANRSREDAGELRRRSDEAAGQLGEQNLARLQVGELLISSAVSGSPSRTPPLTTRCGCSLPKSRRLFATSTGSPETNAIAEGPSSRSSNAVDAGLAGGDLGQRVLHDDVRRVARERAAQLLELRDGQPAVLGEHGGAWSRGTPSVSSATAAALSGLAMGLPSVVRRQAVADATAKRPGARRAGRRDQDVATYHSPALDARLRGTFGHLAA